MLIGEPARTTMLVTLMDGRALTAGELAAAAGVAPPTASGHLGNLLDAGLLALQRQGRHRYYKLATHEVAAMLESIMALSGALDAQVRPKRIATGPRDKGLRRARLCYDHLAGEIAVGIADKMIGRRQLHFGSDGGVLTKEGLQFLAALGVDLDENDRGGDRSSAFCRPCLDWSERRSHIGGAVGRSIYAALVRDGWVRGSGTGRAVSVTPRGQVQLNRHFGLD